jgi:glycosyltransferase involved in cell wall biosynthesis
LDFVVTLLVFDENLIGTSPAGSCLLKVVQGVAGRMRLHLFFNQLDSSGNTAARKTRIPLPRGPVVVRAVLFWLLASAAYLFSKTDAKRISIGTQGAFPFCNISYAHFCHLIFLRNHRGAIGGRFFRRSARLLNHYWGALTERLAFRSAGLIVVPSQGLARELHSAYPKLVAGKIRVIPNPVALAGFARPAGEKPRGETVFCFCALGNFEHKGLRLVLQAFARIPAASARLVVVGGGASEIREYEELAAALGLRDRISFVGLQRDVRPYLWSSDAFLLPSAFEIFPLVCLQAAAAGLPLITTRVHGVDEYAVPGVTGWLVERNAESIAAAMREAVADPAATARMGTEARKRVEQYGEESFHASWNTLLDTYIADVNERISAVTRT